MRAARLLLRLAVVLAGVSSAGAALAQQGLQLRPDALSRWQARLQLNQSRDDVSPSYDARRGSGVLSANLLGDYYLTGSGLGQGVQGGLRATGGLMVGPMSLVQSSSGLALGRAARLNANLSVGQSSLSLLPGPEREASHSMSYVGVGYTSYSLRGGWGFSADVGLVAHGAGLRLGNSAPLDDPSRDARFRPVLQLGVSYSY